MVGVVVVPFGALGKVYVVALLGGPVYGGVLLASGALNLLFGIERVKHRTYEKVAAIHEFTLVVPCLLVVLEVHEERAHEGIVVM